MIILGIGLVLHTLISICIADIRNEITRLEKKWDHQEEIFDTLTDTSIYNKRLRPASVKAGEPVIVNTSLFLISMTSFDEIQTEYTMRVLVRHIWIDPRLSFPENCTVTRVTGDNWHAERIWTPLIFIVNDKNADNLLSTSTGEGNVLLDIQPNGQVLLSRRVHLRLICKMDFWKYPMDKQTCRLELESSILREEEMILAWAEGEPLALNNNFYLTGFELVDYTFYSSQAEYWMTGNFSRLLVTFQLEREFGNFLLEIYIPSILFVVTSWTSFWLEIPAAPARVSLGITTLLTLVTSAKSTREKLPKVSYIHALDVWNVGCTAFIFASLIEYAIVNFIYFKDKRRRQGGLKRIESTATLSSLTSENIPKTPLTQVRARSPKLPPKLQINSSELQPSGFSCNTSAPSTPTSPQSSEGNCAFPFFFELPLTPQDIANGLDKKCRVVFPLLFLLFNIIYWLIF
ncbi:glycine receptor subunit alphaZ1-like isoform X3 [Limulus polyphemus]|uniref:Glycine receptor subunit alphaZ1-like isoform X3 n=1 Tax=Limulus polyphemus TaxID=6850 RepID=A0ABM1S4B3_LIMPO|nr:glycine receptor subunit alphaZ1-like isoform X3 [Limulus polyphemus]